MVPLIEDTNISPGEDIEISAYIIGAGNIGKNQLDVIHEHPKLITDDFGSITVRIATTPEGDIVTGKEAEERFQTSFDLNKTGGKFSFAPRYFRETNRSAASAETDDGQPLSFPISYLDDSHDGGAPIEYQLHTADDTPPGDYGLILLFTYESNGKIYQDRNEIPIHVKTLQEQWEPIPTYALIGGAIVAFFTLLVTAVSLLVTSGIIQL